MTADGALLLSDDELLSALASAFPVDAVEPDAAQLLRLSMAVAELRERTATATTTTPAHPPAAARRQRWSLPRRFSPVVLAGAAIGVLGAGTGISYAVGVPVPAAVRDVARSVGLADPTTPTSAPTLPAATAPSPAAAATAARQAESTLHQALTQSNAAPGVISHDSAVLAHRLFAVGGQPGAGAAGTTADGRQLLNEACRHLEGSGQATTGSPTSHTAAGGTTATFPGCSPVGIWHDPALPTSPSSSFPSATTRTTEDPSSSHSGTGTGGSPFKGPQGGSSGTSSGGTRTGGSTGTTPGLSPGHDTGGSSGDRSGGGTSSGAPSDTGTSSHPGDSNTADDGSDATNPRSGATSG